VNGNLEKYPALFTATVSSDEAVLMRITRDVILLKLKG